MEYSRIPRNTWEWLQIIIAIGGIIGVISLIAYVVSSVSDWLKSKGNALKEFRTKGNKSKDYDDLEKLQKLKDKGTITDDQFQKERDKITNRWD